MIGKVRIFIFGSVSGFFIVKMLFVLFVGFVFLGFLLLIGGFVFV